EDGIRHVHVTGVQTCALPIDSGSRALPTSTGVLVAALASYPFYLAFGYTPVDVGDARLPLSVIVSSLNVLCWYAFVWSYRRTTRGVARTQPMLLWDLALTFLVLASLGGWALALLKPLGITDTAWVVGL